MNRIKVGLPKGLMCYKYKDLLTTFLDNLNIDIIIKDTPDNIVLDETLEILCNPTKDFIKNALSLDNICDYILVPRIKSLKNNEFICPNYYMIYEILKDKLNTKILVFNIDNKKHEDEYFATITLGINLGFTYRESKYAYNNASKYQEIITNKKRNIKDIKLERETRKKILILGKPYNIEKIEKQLNPEYIYLTKENVNVNIDGIIYIYDNTCINDLLKRELIKNKTSKKILEINVLESIDSINNRIKELI